ncbi:DUF1254 domain-containing protein [Geminicoccus flavidas]|uniref:DUF1254 domain-containing protein n=1 Tax=Geminicoccus flavidas TaxID=2506407 RepID=UPI00135863DA|nr:DUF1254 domain-containing protein [Geminicoccus flavidas]
MRTLCAVATLVAGLIANHPSIVAAAEQITEQEAHAIGVEAYLYFYPLVTMDITRKQLTNVATPNQIVSHAPTNMFAHIPAYPSADLKAVVRPNFDTLYSSAWLDLTEEPIILSVPDTQGRYYLMPMLDMWTDVFASPGWRTTGTEPGEFAIVPQGWEGDLPGGVKRIDAPTEHVWIIGRTKTDGPDDYAAVHKIQAGLTLTPLSQWSKPAKPAEVKVDPSIDMKTPPKLQVDTMSAEKYFAYASELLMVHAPHVTDQPILAEMERVGLERGKRFDLATADPAIRKAFERVPEDAQRLMAWKVPTLASVVNGWSMNTDTMGVYGTYYLKRAIVSQLGLGANLPEDAVYPLNLGDSTGRPLNGENKYTIHFDAANMPPVDAFWSITLYDREGFQVANSLNRFAVASWMPFKHNADGSLDIVIQHENPGKDMEQNWLPAPKGPYNLTMRLYAPRSDVLTGKWRPPAVLEKQDVPTLVTQ